MSIIACINCSLTYFNIDLLRVRDRRVDTNPVHVHPRDILSVGREAGHSGGILK